MTVARALLLALALLAACGGVSKLERCVEHSLEEGVARDRAEAGCRAAVGDD